MTAGAVEIMIWGRGGQGAKTAGDFLTLSLYRAGCNPLGQPRYSADRMGAPVAYALRFYPGGDPIVDRSWIRDPQYVLLFDLTLLVERNLETGWRPGAMVVANARPDDPLLQRLKSFCVFIVDASAIARECGLMKGSVPALSSVMPGAFAGVTRLLTLDCLEDCMSDVGGPISRYPEPNRRALHAGYARATLFSPSPRFSE